MQKTVRILTVISVSLALMCFGLAIAFRQANMERLCWRVMFEDGDWPAEGACHPSR